MRKLIPFLIAAAIATPLAAHADPEDGSPCSDCHPVAADMEDTVQPTDIPEPTHITVRTVEGVKHFTRGGIRFTEAPTTLAISDLTEAQLHAILGQSDQLDYYLHGHDPNDQREAVGIAVEPQNAGASVEPKGDQHQIEGLTITGGDGAEQSGVPVEIVVDGESYSVKPDDVAPPDLAPSSEQPTLADTPRSKRSRK